MAAWILGLQSPDNRRIWLRRGLALQSDRRLVTAGSIVRKTSLSGKTTGFGLMRFASDGTVDSSFETRGGVIAAFSGFTTAAAFPLLIQPDSDIVAGAAPGRQHLGVRVDSLSQHGETRHYLRDWGLVTTSFLNSMAAIASLALQSDRKLVAAGSDGAGTLVVARYLR